METLSFAFGEWRGEVARARRPSDLDAEITRILDPSAAVESLHWGRNYLYRVELATTSGPVAAVVKQFRSDRWRDRLNAHRKGSKAYRNWTMARAAAAAGVPTPEPLLFVESTRPGGASYFVSAHLEGYSEARYLLRAARAEVAEERFPLVDLQRFLIDVGQLARRLHDAGIRHRDFSVGNVLFRPRGDAERRCDLALIDLNRARFVTRLSTWARSRELCRLALFRRQDQETLLEAYWGPRYGAAKLRVFHLCHELFQLKHRLRAPRQAVLGALKALAPRRAHAHIPAAPADAGARDRVVWDHLSDQPHQHAGRGAKLRVRLADAPAHLGAMTTALLAAPRIRRRYRELRAGLDTRPIPWPGMGLALRPWPEDRDALLACVDELGTRQILLRLHPWDSDSTEEERLARELVARGCELAFALPQNRELVRDPARWRRSIATLAERFAPLGRQFQIGQAINRSKWGIWAQGEYLDLVAAATQELRKVRADVEILGPAVIDFELHATAAVVNARRAGVHFDIVSSLLYVDRRGAPENPQLGFDTVGKVLLAKAIADTARSASPRSWITEVNWPLWEGPHSPAGKSVSVDEETQASYLSRFYLLALTTGAVERVYWWQLVARGYGLVCPEPGGVLRRRSAFRAFAALRRELENATYLGPVSAPPGVRVLRFARPAGREVLVGWTVGRDVVGIELPGVHESVCSRDGEALPRPASGRVELGPAVRFFRF